MHILRRIFPLVLLALLLALAVACNSGGTAPTTSDQPAGGDGGSTDLAASSPLDVLSASAESFQREVSSLQAELEFSIVAGGFPIAATADMAFQAPDQMHVTMDLSGLGSFEMLMLGSEIYMNLPPQGWVVFSVEDLLGGEGLADLGVDTATFQDLLSDRSFVDYEALVNAVSGDIEDLGEETLEGGTYRHFRGSIDFADVAAAFSDAFGATDNLNLDDVSGPLTFDVWVSPDTSLPYKLTASGEFAFGADSMLFDATMLFTNYNEPVEIPGAPADAIPFAALFSGLE
jgi:hypothetical protein